MGTKKLYIGTNTKMYKTIADTVQFLEILQEKTGDISRSDVFFLYPNIIYY
ncbi:hypothetical protein FACS189491_08090 [Spirochaetia bacterium]|nr:hypothetical protein FACS189491_08090 [Spirochaetia bacterium]